MADTQQHKTLEEYLDYCMPVIVQNTVTVFIQKRTCEYIGNVAKQLFMNLHAHEEKPDTKYVNHFLDLYSAYREKGTDDVIAEFKSLKHAQIAMLTDYYNERKQQEEQ